MEETLGKRIVSNRKRIHLTQDQLAERLGVTAQAVSKWENDQSCPDINMLPKLAQIFGVSTDELLGHEMPQPVHEVEIVTEEENDGIHFQKDNWEFKWDSSRTESITFACLVLMVGVLTFLSRYLNWGVGFWSILWPSSLLVYGVKSTLQKFKFFSLGCALFGGYFLTTNLNLINFDLDSALIFPLIIVLFGLSLLVDALRKPKKPTFRMKHNHSDKASSHFQESEENFDCSLSFVERNVVVSLPLLSSGTAKVNFGELTVDLTKCQKISNDCSIDLSCSFGELELLVPSSCKVDDLISRPFATVEYTGLPDDDADTVIHVNGECSFGEITISYI